MSEQKPPFWRVKSFTEMTLEEWESLCDGCGRCCLNKVIDADTDEVHTTAIACRLLDLESGRCKHYPQRRKYVSDCIKFTPDNLHEHAQWLPESCAYHLLNLGFDLPEWHPLVTGDPDSVHQAGFSIKDKPIRSEEEVPDPADWFDYIIRVG